MNGPDTLKFKVWIILAGKEPQPAKMLAIGKVNTE